MKQTLSISGMHCNSCALNIEESLKKSAGVNSVSVNFATGKAVIEGEIKIEKVKEVVESLGYRIGDKADKDDQVDINEIKRMVIFSGLLSLPIFLLAMGWEVIGQIGPIGQIGETGRNIILLLLTTPVQFIAGFRFYKGAWQAMRNGFANRDTLVALGTSAAYFYSLAVVLGLLPGTVFFETAALLIFFLLLGKYLEAMTVSKTRQAIQKLMEVGAKKARIVRNIRDMGDIREIAIEEVKVGDLLLVKPGEKVAVDGVIIDGQSMIDESMVTGESMPVEKKTGDKVIGGTINKNGSFIFRAEKIGSQTLLNQIIDFVEKAQAAKAPTQQIADKISSIFVPSIIAIAFLVMSYWLWVGRLPLEQALSYGIAVLVIACPCALGLATPTAIMVGTGVGARRGILIKGGEALQKAENINMVVFDKTGTLTKGEPEVMDIISDEAAGHEFFHSTLSPLVLQSSQSTQSNLSKGAAVMGEAVKNYGPASPHKGALEKGDAYLLNYILQVAASVELKSEHPLGQAIVKKAKERNLVLDKVSNFQALPGFGVSGIINSIKISVGKVKKADNEFVRKWTSKGATVVQVDIENSLAGYMAIADSLKENSKAAVDHLKEKGYQVAMISGDNQQTADEIGRQLGIEKIKAGVLPEDKAKIIGEFKGFTGIGGQKNKIAFVGDGINDAPALTIADLGIAMGGGTDVARESGDIVLVKDDPLAIVEAIGLAKATFNKVKFNFFWAFAYNILGIPIAAGLLSGIGITLKPELAGLAMAFSSVSVVSNSLLLKRFKVR